MRGDGRITHGATPFLPGGEGQAKHDGLDHACTVQRREETVESLNGLGNPELTVRSNNELTMRALRDAIAQRTTKIVFCVRAISQVPPKYDSLSVGLTENAINHGTEKVRTLVTAASEFHGICRGSRTCCTDLVCTLCWTVHFSNNEKRGWTQKLSSMRFSASLTPRAILAAWVGKVVYLEATKKKVQLTQTNLRRYLLGVDGSEELIIGTLSGCLVCRIVKGRPS